MSTYFITGATGYIGSMLIKHIKDCDTDAAITAVVRDREKARNLLPGGVNILQIDLTDETAMKKIEAGYDYIIHCASVTKSAEMISHPAEVIESIVNTTQNVLKLARRCHVKSMAYISSMEVYGDINCSDGHRVSEKELGTVELFNPRSCYPMGKRMAESICYFYYKEYGIPVKIARLAQTFGKGILPTDNRVFAQFAKAIKYGEDIVLYTQGNSMGNYCSIDDTVEGILTILEHGTDGEAYNVVNEENTMTIRQMAELVAEKIADGKIQIAYDIPEVNQYGYAADTGIRLSGQKLTKLGWKPTKKLKEMYEDLLEE